MVDFEGLEQADLAAALVTGPTHRLTRRTTRFRDLIPFWRPGQEAGIALAGPDLRPLLRALDLAGSDRPAPLITVPQPPSPGGPPGQVLCAVSCTAVDPAESDAHGSVLLLATPVRSEPSGAAARQHVTADRAEDLARYEALLSAVPQVVWRMTADQGETYTLVGRLGETGGGLWNPAGPGFSWMDAVHPKDHNAFAEQWAATARGDALLDAVVRIRQEGDPVRYRHMRIVTVPVLRDGAVAEWIGTVADAEDQWRVRTRDRLLERVSAVSSTDNLPRVFATTAAAVVPDLTDALAIFQLRYPDEAAAGTGALYATRVRTALAKGVAPLGPIDDDFALGALSRETIDRRRTQMITFPPGRPPEGLVSDASAAWMERAQATSIALIPIVIDGRTAALAAASSCLGNPPPAEIELGLLEEVLRSVEEPLRRTLELRSLRTTALTLQRSFLITPPQIRGGELDAVYHPASTTAEIGGDWYDATVLPDGALALSIGDVAGHDLQAATEMTKASSMLRALAYTADTDGPAHTLSRLDQVTHGVSTAALITAMHAVLRPTTGHRWQVTLSNAGHPPPLLIPATGHPRHLNDTATPDLPLCVTPGAARHEGQFDLHDGDILLLYTDGLVERRGTDISESMDQLAHRAASLRSPDRSLSALLKDLLPPAGEAIDDIAVIAFRADRTRHPMA
ncbi:SpoIIE family protein phosphatase [Streptomyces californicus]|uniref:SpoIIE family protein phosphatase n=1 Tax=Streptomyces californicus TaxID=67351 RepID=UPI00296FBAE7|nr:SpoIIE family protein phosphatase [Streptomyces californicus]MDW4916322.1 SpoIIE family protein phosphatase [Streptomyces californicus]